MVRFLDLSRGLPMKYGSGKHGVYGLAIFCAAAVILILLSAWYIGLVKIHNGNRVTLSAANLTLGTHTLRVTALRRKEKVSLHVSLFDANRRFDFAFVVKNSSGFLTVFQL
jgi:hypothetical protein